MPDNRMIVVLMDLFKLKQVNLYELSIKTGIDRDRLVKLLDTINQLLVEKGFSSIQEKEGTYLVSDGLIAAKDTIFSLFKHQDIYLSQEERLGIIYLYTFCRQEFISNNHYQDLLHVSRNTTLTDIKLLKETCQLFEVQLEYTRAEGYHLIGREENKYRLALYAISHLLQSPIGEWAMAYVMDSWGEAASIDQLSQTCQKVSQLYKLSSIEDRLREYLYLIQFLGLRYKRVLAGEQEVDFASNQTLIHLSHSLLETVSHVYGLPESFISEFQFYYASLLQGAFEGNQDISSDFFHQLTIEIVEEMERLSLIAFDKRSELIAGLERHLIPAYHRLKSHLVAVNSYTDLVKEEHSHLFQLVKEALSPLRRVLGFDLPDSEISYFVIHFGGYIQGQKETAFGYKALVICPNGVSSSLILKENLKNLFPGIKFLERQSIEAITKHSLADVDMIFSTVKIATDRPFFLVPPLFNEEQKKELFHLVNSQFPQSVNLPLKVERLVAIIQKHANIQDQEALTYDLIQFMTKDHDETERRSPLLDELITERTYRHTDQALSWEEAIAQTAAPLLDEGIIEADYVGAMIQKVKDFGPFIDLGKGVAIPHARPDEGVNRIGMSMMSFEQPVQLLNDPQHEIRLMICIAAVDNQTHLKALSHLTAILREEANIQKLISSKTFSDIAAILKED